MVTICSSLKDHISLLKDDISSIKENLIDLRAHLQGEQEKEKEDIPNFWATDSCDVSMKIFEVPKVEPEIVYKEQIEKNSKVVFALFVTKEKTIREVDPIQVDIVDFVILESFFSAPLNTKTMLSSILFPKNFDSYRVMILSKVFQNVLPLQRSLWLIL